jgi:drug/metabolite transporter (DMT)-like permease
MRLSLPGSRRAAYLYLLAAAAFWSTSGAFLKSMPSVHWLVIAGARSLFATLLFLPGLRQPRPPGRKLIALILLYSVLVSALMGSMQLGTAAQGIWLQYVAPAVIALWVVVARRERLRPTESLAILLTLGAIVLFIRGGEGRAHVQSVILGVVSGVAGGCFLLVLKSVAEAPPPSIHLWTNLATALALLPVARALGVGFPGAWRELLLLAGMGLGQLALPYYFFQRGLSRTRALEASLVVLVEPLLNPVWVYLIVGEVPGKRVMAACGLIAVGLVIFALGAGRRRADGQASAARPGACGGG